LALARALKGCSSTRAEVAARTPSSERRLITPTSKMEDMETLLQDHASSGPSELGRFGEEYTAKMTGRRNNPPEKRRGSEMQFMVQSLGARLPQT
jgi:hypothetical protein